jgi:hypothetical protein
VSDLLNNLNYDPDSGTFCWIESPRSNVKAGSRAGYARPDGYRDIRVGGVLYKEHRLAWLAVYGSMPDGEIDHIDGDPSNNKIKNLRLATSVQNKQNARAHRDNKCGLKGVSLHRSGKWVAWIKINKKIKYLGLHPTPEEAYAVYCKEAEEAFGEFYPRDRAGRLSLRRDE